MEQLFNWLDIYNNTWVLHVFLVVLATVVINLVIRIFLKHAHARFEQTSNLWDDALIEAIKRPILLFVWVIGISLAAKIIEPYANNEIFEMTGLARRIAIILLLVMFLVRLIRNIEVNILSSNEESEAEADEITVKIIGRLLRLSVIITGTLVVLQTLGISVSGVLAFGGIGGIAVGFAAKDMLANFFGGMMIYLDRPFKIGDWIRSPDRNIEGVVEDIGWRLTVIRTFDKRPLYLPNSTFTTIAVENPSRMSNRRIFETFGLRYCDAGKMKTILKDVKEMLQQHEAIDTQQIIMANFTTLSASSLDFFIYTLTRTVVWAEYHEVKQDVLLKVIDIIHAHDADIAFPTRTVEGMDALLESIEKPSKG